MNAGWKRGIALVVVAVAVTASAQAVEPASFKDCDKCPEMVVVPSGGFRMGSPETESNRAADEGPQVDVAVSAFAIGRYEVTFQEWDVCVADGGCRGYSPDDYGWGRGRRPVIFVDDEDVAAYLGWLSKETGHPYRLPSEAEWEYAARGGSTTAYPWGDAFEAARVSNGSRTMPVGSFPPNGFGLHDMIGNVWERVGACWSDYPATGAFSPPCRQYTSRGGGIGTGATGLRVANRNRQTVHQRAAILGFRVARDLDRP